MVRKLLIGLLLLVNCLLFYGVVLSDKGIFSLRRMRVERDELAAVTDVLKENSQDLSQEILLFKKGGEYTERIIRDKTNFIKDDEVVYIIGSGGKTVAAPGQIERGIGGQ
ncbi:septum formation initiator [Desulfocurvibacter africanus PCS]|uniref:Septum formation initiator n=1 Tax=Desulfocurvibacter africanus PCS TaxID=1262666 RepID=M5PWQ8_DESAF|nr:septum formation initiator family protein [Desulfocurvibacter africanus]EMG38752.1 septum formation initiator [Desulfocurvibacter africanus PCS]